MILVFFSNQQVNWRVILWVIKYKHDIESRLHMIDRLAVLLSYKLGCQSRHIIIIMWLIVHRGSD